MLFANERENLKNFWKQRVHKGTSTLIPGERELSEYQKSLIRKAKGEESTTSHRENQQATKQQAKPSNKNASTSPPQLTPKSGLLNVGGQLL